MVSVIIAAGGTGKRMGAGYNKLFMPLGGREIIARTLAVFDSSPHVDEIVLVSAANDFERMHAIIRRDGFTKISALAEGGSERQHSVRNGLAAVTGDIVLIHDGARCLITHDEIAAVVADAKTFGAAALGVTVKDTLKSIDSDGNITATVDREHTVHIQTPQAFKTVDIIALHDRAIRDSITVTDDCSIYEHYGRTVHLTRGSYDNIKITTPEDIAVGEQILKRRGNL